MRIPKKQLLNWKSLKEHSDLGLIAEETGLHRNTVSNAFLKGSAEQSTIDAIEGFYKKRKKELA